MTRRSLQSLKNKYKKKLEESAKRRVKQLATTHPYALIHWRGCKGIAFYYKNIPDDQCVDAAHVIMPNGAVPTANMPCICFSCGGAMLEEDVYPEMFVRVQ